MQNDAATVGEIPWAIKGTETTIGIRIETTIARSDGRILVIKVLLHRRKTRSLIVMGRLKAMSEFKNDRVIGVI